MHPTAHGKPKVVGLTGGMATGKSTARAALQRLGVPCIDIDTVARDIHQDPAHPVARTLAKTFPDWMTADGALQRGSLPRLFARDAHANRLLVDLLKPHVLAAVDRWTRAQSAPYVVWESALLRQEAMAVDRFLIVNAPLALRLERIRRRKPGWSDEQVASILAMQSTPPDPSNALPDGPAADTICNNGSTEVLQNQVAVLHRRYTALWN